MAPSRWTCPCSRPPPRPEPVRGRSLVPHRAWLRPRGRSGPPGRARDAGCAGCWLLRCAAFCRAPCPRCGVRGCPWVSVVASLTDIDDRECRHSATVGGTRALGLLTILMEHTRVPRTSVAALAERYGVSPRTIQRDITALHEMGVPVWTRTGPSGGVGMVEGWRSPITGMAAPELQALIIGEAGARGLGLHTDFETARLKMLTTNAAQAETVEPAQERFLIDNERWFSEPEHPAALPDVARAVWSGRRLTIDYLRSGGERTPRRRLLDPLGLVLKTDSWYLVAAHRRSLRTYRLSRICSTVRSEEHTSELQS